LVEVAMNETEVEAEVETECLTCENWGTVVTEDGGRLREVACPAHVGPVPIPARVLQSPAAKVRTFNAGDLVRVRTEESLSVIVLPTDERAAACDVPAGTPEVTVCCVPLALVRTPADDEHGTLRWVEAADLLQVETPDT
jgi:hypothetical protein